MDFTNLLEGVAPANLPAARKKLLEQVQSGALQVNVGTLRESIGADMFDALVLDAMHKRAMKGYNGFRGKDDWRKIVTVKNNVPDFRSQNAVRLGSYGGLDKIPEGGRYKVKKPTDEKVSYLVNVYGNMEALTFQAMVNDELGLLGKYSERFGGASARERAKFVFKTLIDDNPNMEYDGVPMIHSSHNNDLGSAKALNYANLKAARILMQNQTGLDSEPLNIEPDCLIVHPDLEEDAWRLIRAGTVMVGAHDAAASATEFESNKNFHEGRYDLIVTPYITPTKWYLTAKPDQIDTLEVGFLTGHDTPQVSMENKDTGFEFESDGRRVKVRDVFGGTGLEHRWIVGADAA